MLLEPGSRDVLVVAGLPGAGKTTLAASEPRALDSDDVRTAWAPRMAGIPYPLWRPLAHAWHWLALWRALGRADGVVVVRPFTSGRLRRAVLRRARRHHRAVHLLVVDATPAQARAGQHARGRRVGERAMRRHERRWAGADLAQEGWTTVLRVPRGADSQRILRRLSADSRASRRAWAHTHPRRGTAPNKPSHPGATIARTETDGDSAAPYESHITTSARQGARGPRQQGLRGHRGTRASRSPVAPSRLGARRRA